MNYLAKGALCALVCSLLACGGSGSDKQSSSSVAAVSSSSSSSSEANSSSASSLSSAIDSSVASSSVKNSAASLSASSTLNSSSSAQSLSSNVSSSSASSISSLAVKQTGFFVDSVVAGLTYQTSPGGFNGVTSAEGAYDFAEGDTVVFSIGDIKFPAITAKNVVTPLDMADDPSSLVVTNIAVLLQSLDSDGDPDNGITIPAAAATAATSAINFNQAYASFSAAVLPVVRHSDAGKAVVSETTARNHLDSSMKSLQQKLLIGSWYLEGTGFKYVLFVLDAENYAAIDLDGTDIALERGKYTWNQSTGLVSTTNVTRTDNTTSSLSPRVTGAGLKLDGNKLTLTGTNDTFVLQRLTPSAGHALKGGWSRVGQEFVVVAFTDTHYFLGQDSPSVGDGHSGAETGSYTYNPSTEVFTLATESDTNGDWGFSHPCAIAGVQGSNNWACGPNGQLLTQTMDIRGNMMMFSSDNVADTDETLFERIVAADDNKNPAGVLSTDINLKLEITQTVTAYTQGTRYESDSFTMQCDLDHPLNVGDVETYNETWLLSPSGKSWGGTSEVAYNPFTKIISSNNHTPIRPVKGYPKFREEFWESFEGTYNPGQTDVITGTVKNTYWLTYDGFGGVSKCNATFSVVGRLRQ